MKKLWHSKHKQIEQRIADMTPGSVFVIFDFSDLAEPKTVSKTLARLLEAGTIEKVMRGVFWKPDSAASPHPDDVAHAIARENVWQLVPCGDTALHIVGIEEQHPNVWTYVTDGNYRSYSYDGKIISFLHSSGKNFSAVSEKAALLVQVIKACGQGKLSEEYKFKIRAFFKPEEVRQILRECRFAPEWVIKAIRGLFGKKELA